MALGAQKNSDSDVSDTQSPNGPFTHSTFNAISDAISRRKRRLTPPCTKAFFAKHRVDWKDFITYYLKTPFFPISANLAVFCSSVTRLKTRAG